MKSGEQITQTLLEPDRPKMKVQYNRPKSNPKLSYILILMHQQVKNAPGKQMNILLKTSPKILTHKREKTLKTKDISAHACSRAGPCPFMGINVLFPPRL